MMEKIKNMNKEEIKKLLIQFIKFGLVGVSNTLISLLVYYILVYFKCNYIVANTLGFIISVINAYYWNNKYVFKKNTGRKEEKTYKKIIKVYVSYGVTFLLSTLLLYLMVDCFKISEYIAPIINLCVTVPLNFIFNKFWAFKN